MDRDPRERERGVARSDVASLWIDFLLLPQKLEEHLVAGPAAIPAPFELISMFLEQALVNHKSMLGNNSSANIALKDAEPQGTVKTTSKTASLLCERAARVAVVMCHTLSDIESSIQSQLHQFILLKSLIRHDNGRSLIHQCNLHRWLIHKALQSHPVGSASPNVVLPVNRLGAWIAGDDLGEVFHGVANGIGDPLPSNHGDSRFEEERASVEFLENVLQVEDMAVKHKDSIICHTDLPSQKATANGGSNTEEALSTAYKCQVILDVAEVYFMRGRIRKAHELFSKCGEMLSFLPGCEHPGAVELKESIPLSSVPEASNLGTLSKASPVPQERLSGFLTACKMLLGTLADGNGVETKRSVRCAGTQDLSFVGAPSATQWAIIASEQSRRAARKYGNNVTSQSGLANGDSGGSDFSSGKENVGASVSERTSTDTLGQTLEDRSAYHLSNRSKKRTYLEEANGDLVHKDSQLDKEESLCSETVKHGKESAHKAVDVDKMQVDETPFFTVKRHAVDGHSNGDEGKAHEKKGFGKEEGSWKWNTVNENEGKVAVQSFGEKLSRTSIGNVKNEPVTSISGGAGCGSEVELFVDLKGDPLEDTFPKMENDMKCAPSTKQEKCLIQTFVEDILRGHLSWAYCLAVERDSLLSKPVRSRLAACNVVRLVLEGAPVESFLRTRAHFDNSEDAVEFLMQLLLAIKVMQDGNKFSVLRPPFGGDSRQHGRLVKLGFSKQSLEGMGARDSDVSVVACRVGDLAMYVCCVIDKPWCWGCAVKLGLVGQSDLPRFSGQLPRSSLKNVDGSGIFLKAGNQLESEQSSSGLRGDDLELSSESEILLSFVQVESIHELEGLVGKVRTMAGRVKARRESTAVNERLHRVGHLKRKSEHGQSHFDASNSWLASSKSQAGMKCQSTTTTGLDRGQCSSLEADVAAILRRRAFIALETTSDVFVAKRLYELALTFQPGDIDCAMMLWLLERSKDLPNRDDMYPWTRDLPKKREGDDMLPTVGLLDFVILHLIEKELWATLREFCKWAVLFILPGPTGRDGEQGMKTEKDIVVGPSGVGGASDSAAIRNTAGWQFRQKRLLQTLNVARTLVDLIPLCDSLQTAVSRNQFNEDVARLGSTLSQLFEDFLCFLVGIESDGQMQRMDDPAHQRSTQAGLRPLPHSGSAGVPLISKLSNPRVLVALASLTAGWLQRCHVVGLTPWPLAVERYGVMAGATAGASLPPPVGSSPYAPSVLRPVPPRVSPEFGRDLFGVLLEGIVGLPGLVEGDREKGHRWLQGLADLAFEEDAYVKALRLYLQAGAIRSAQYCDRASSMSRDIFTPWVIERMVGACRAIGAGVQAAVLCQCLPGPDHESAFRILQENTLIMDRDAAAYFECLWEVPILELLVHLHSRAGDEARVASLIGLLQQPALNVHNPPAIRQAHISTMEQRFLQRLAGELL